MMAQDLLIEKKIEMLVQMQAKAMQREIDELKKIIVTLNDDMIGLKQQMRNSIRPIMEEAAVEEKPKQQKIVQPKVMLNDEAHHRTGQFKPGDIDIQKVFYFGNK